MRRIVIVLGSITLMAVVVTLYNVVLRPYLEEPSWDAKLMAPKNPFTIDISVEPLPSAGITATEIEVIRTILEIEQIHANNVKARLLLASHPLPPNPPCANVFGLTLAERAAAVDLRRKAAANSQRYTREILEFPVVEVPKPRTGNLGHPEWREFHSEPNTILLGISRVGFNEARDRALAFVFWGDDHDSVEQMVSYRKRAGRWEPFHGYTCWAPHFGPFHRLDVSPQEARELLR